MDFFWRNCGGAALSFKIGEKQDVQSSYTGDITKKKTLEL